MKWEKYHKLTKEQRLEWEFKFKDNYPPRVALGNLVALVALNAVMGSFLVVMSVLPDKFSAYQWLLVWQYTVKITVFFVYLWVAEFLYGLIEFFIVKYKENRWLKQVLGDK